MLIEYVPMPPVVPVSCATMGQPVGTPVPGSSDRGESVPEPTAVTVMIAGTVDGPVVLPAVGSAADAVTEAVSAAVVEAGGGPAVLGVAAAAKADTAPVWLFA